MKNILFLFSIVLNVSASWQLETIDTDTYELLRSIVKHSSGNLIIVGDDKHLPPNFQNVTSLSYARFWFEQMISESSLFAVKHKELDTVLGFIFAFIENERDAHIGYLLGEKYWGQGLGSELLKGFIDKAVKEQKWARLIGGVDIYNKASSKLLTKLGFTAQSSGESQVKFYEYLLSEK